MATCSSVCNPVDTSSPRRRCRGTPTPTSYKEEDSHDELVVPTPSVDVDQAEWSTMPHATDMTCPSIKQEEYDDGMILSIIREDYGKLEQTL